MSNKSRLVIAAFVAVAALVASSCGSDSEGASDTTEAAEETELQPCQDVYSVTPIDPEGPEAIETRSAPQMQACEFNADGLYMVDEIVGTGAEVTPGSTVEAQYSGALVTDGSEFDSSWSRGAEPISFPLDGVIDGWSQGLVGMKAGGRRTLVIPSDLAYGAQSPGAGIPANADLVFTVDLVSVS